MQKLYKDLLQNYIEMLDIHIDCKQTDMPFHEITEEFYEKLFEIAHEIGERHVDDGGRTRDDSVQDQKQKAASLLSDTVQKLESSLENDDLSEEGRKMVEDYLDQAKQMQQKAQDL
ncbi:hypothetical protein [Candidatus Absconditicoccus praedator]|uniref:hypothetical protein n=1 Tax=Candidatus Absconditicoccus praedator TaxID=2735562 RepID=UPI001E41AEA2|nr:hypothetical protein [Candidatus Absconditicoccus praedator]UFX82741.1 hypothetical protein HLG78_01145 [Candidatus Absconditicoccus praedator]